LLNLKKSSISIVLAAAICSSQITAETNIENVQILAKNLNNKGDLVQASGDVLIFSPSYYITADEVLYNKKDNTLELFNKVNILKNNELLSVSDHAFIDFKNDAGTYDPQLLLDKKTNLWVNAKKSQKNQNIHTFTSSTLSSCDCDDPFWSIGFSSGDYDSKDKWINTYNSVLYVGDVPLLYVPWYGFSTDRTRRTGLLKPTFGLSKEQGFFYSQSFFYAPELNWDMEFTPQIRTLRGAGAFVEYRLADSANSQLNIKSGIFDEKSSYKDEYDIVNNNHYGFDLTYKKDGLLTENNDGLSISLHKMNDIAYETLFENNIKDSNVVNNKTTSSIKYYYNTSKSNTSLEVKKTEDVRESSNQDEILQELPIVKHNYSNSITLENIENSTISYSPDFTFINYNRQIGIEAKYYNVNIPITFSMNGLFDDYLNFSFKEEINSYYLDYSGGSTSFSDGKFIENKHIFNLSTTALSKPITDSLLHTVSFGASYVIPDILRENGDLYFSSTDNTNSLLSEFPISKTKKHVNLTLNHSLYDSNNLEEIINHRLTQSINLDNGNSELSNLESSLTYYYAYGSLSNKLVYNHQNDEIVTTSTNFNFKKDDFYINVDYINTKDTSNYDNNEVGSYSYTDLDADEVVNVKIGNTFNRYYTFQYQESYDLDDDISNLREYSVITDKNCWSLALKLADDLVAAPTSSNEAIRQKVVYIEFTMKPIGGINQQYQISDNN
jgi:LPS-assembly protein